MLKRLLLVSLLVCIAFLLGGAGGVYWAMTSTQPYYTNALAQDPAILEAHSRQLESRITALHSDTQTEGQWRTVVAADEINGWLALKLPESFPDLLPSAIRNPRTAITPNAVIVAAQSDVAGVETVVSVVVDPYVTEEGDLAIEINQVLAGALPVPNKEVIERLTVATRQAQLPIRWTQNAGRSVMIVARSLWENGDRQQRVLEAIELAEGELFLSGRTETVEKQPTRQAARPAPPTGR